MNLHDKLIQKYTTNIETALIEKQLKKIEFRRQDILHFIENTDKITQKGMVNIYNELKKINKIRRKIKEDLLAKEIDDKYENITQPNKDEIMLKKLQESKDNLPKEYTNRHYKKNELLKIAEIIK